MTITWVRLHAGAAGMVDSVAFQRTVDYAEESMRLSITSFSTPGKWHVVEPQDR